jgi:hypothetical protein
LIRTAGIKHNTEVFYSCSTNQGIFLVFCVVFYSCGTNQGIFLVFCVVLYSCRTNQGIFLVFCVVFYSCGTNQGIFLVKYNTEQKENTLIRTAGIKHNTEN